jgi:uncharacterized membrane protein (DUF2068 family)
MMAKYSLTTGVRAVALVEAGKAALVLLAGFGLFALIHHDVQAIAEQWVGRLHLNPARKYPSIFIQAAGKITDARLVMMATLAMCYSLVRSIEAYGLWRERRWAEWFGMLSGAIYVPLEIYELARGASWIKVAALIINLAVVGYLALVLYRSDGRLQRGS